MDTYVDAYERLLAGAFGLEGPGWRHVSCGAKDLIRLAMNAAPGERPCASALLGHPWLKVSPNPTLTLTLTPNPSPSPSPNPNPNLSRIPNQVDADRGSAADGGGVGVALTDGAHRSPLSVGSLAAALPPQL